MVTIRFYILSKAENFTWSLWQDNYGDYVNKSIQKVNFKWTIILYRVITSSSTLKIDFLSLEIIDDAIFRSYNVVESDAHFVLECSYITLLKISFNHYLRMQYSKGVSSVPFDWPSSRHQPLSHLHHSWELGNSLVWHTILMYF